MKNGCKGGVMFSDGQQFMALWWCDVKMSSRCVL